MVDYMDVVPEPNKNNDELRRGAIESIKGLQFGIGQYFNEQFSGVLRAADIVGSSALIDAARRAASSYQGKMFGPSLYANIRKIPEFALSRNQLSGIVQSFNSLNVLKPLYSNEYLNNVFYKNNGMVKQFAELSQSVSEYFREISTNWLSSTAQLLEYIKAMHGPNYPSNMKKALGGEYNKDWLTTVLYDEGIPLYAVPNPKIIQRLRRASSAASRRSILGRELSAITNDCRLLIRPEAKNANERKISRWIEESAAVISEGHIAAGMTLLSSVLELLIEKHLPSSKRRLMYPSTETAQNLGIYLDKSFEFRVKGKMVSDFVAAYGEMQTRIALFPLLSAYRKMYEKAKNNIYIEGPYSRHAIAHRPSVKLFTKANASQALLCATSLSAYVYHW